MDRSAKIPDGEDAMRVTAKTPKLSETWLLMFQVCKANLQNIIQGATHLWLGG